MMTQNYVSTGPKRKQIIAIRSKSTQNFDNISAIVAKQSDEVCDG